MLGFGLRVLGRERRRRSDIALADGYIGSFEAKCLYNHWCLVTAQFHAPPGRSGAWHARATRCRGS